MLSLLHRVARGMRWKKACGIKFNPNGLMSNMRRIYKPKSHTVRDWMHMLVSGGVANTQLALVLNLIVGQNITLKVVGKFVESVKLPWRLGKTDANWVSKNRLGKKKETLSSFAGIMLSLIPIIACFLQSLVSDASHPLYEHRLCLGLLCHIIGLLSLGPADAMNHIPLLKDLIREWSTMYERLYPGNNVKPKFHNFVIHVVDDMTRVGKLLSCFVTERKHRTTKRAALMVFRHIDNTVIKDLLNRQCRAIEDPGQTLFVKQYLMHPKPIMCDDIGLLSSLEVVVPIGSLRVGDVLWLRGGRIGKLGRFWAEQNNAHTICAQISVYSPAENGNP